MAVEKKRLRLALILSLIFFAFIVIAFLPHHTVYAQSTSVEQVLGFNPESLPQSPEDISELGKNYLREGWGKFLNNTKFTKPLIDFYHKHQQGIDKTSVILLGTRPSLSWFYLLVIVLWFSFALYIFRALEFLKLISDNAKYLAAFIAACLLSFFGVTRILAGWIVDTIGKFSETWWIQLLAGLGVLVALIFLDTFSSSLRNSAKGLTEQKRLENIEKKAESAGAWAEENEKIYKEIDESSGEDED